MEYQSISQLRFGPAGKRTFAVAMHGGANFLLVDGKEQGPFEYILLHDALAASPDGRSYAFFDRKPGQYEEKPTTLYVNGKPKQSMHSIWHLSYSPDGRLVYGYLASRSGNPLERGKNPNYLVVGDKQFHVKPTPTGPLFSADGKHLAYLATDDQHRSIHYVVDGKAYPPDHNPQNATFTADGKHFAYVGISGRAHRYQLYVDGAPAGSAYQTIPVGASASRPVEGGIALRPDGSFATLALRDNAIYRITVTP
jgi:hypothetical protein